MKTITEFSGFTLKEAIAKKAALISEGKTEEEAQAVISEQLKLIDEVKVGYYKNAVDMTNSRVAQVKRVVVALKSVDTEVVPTAFAEREGHFYLVEYFPQAGAVSRGHSDDRDDRGSYGKGGGRGGNDRGRGGPGGGRGGNDRGRGNGDRPQGERSFGDRPPRGGGDRPAPAPRAPGGNSPFVVNPADPTFKPKHPAQPRPARAPRPPRAPRPEGASAQQGPKGLSELRLVLKGQSQSTLPGSGITPATPVVESSSESASN